MYDLNKTIAPHDYNMLKQNGSKCHWSSWQIIEHFCTHLSQIIEHFCTHLSQIIEHFCTHLSKCIHVPDQGAYNFVLSKNVNRDGSVRWKFYSCAFLGLFEVETGFYFLWGES